MKRSIFFEAIASVDCISTQHNYCPIDKSNINLGKVSDRYFFRRCSKT
ncbi:MAG: hypothetical protein SWX82_11810 [Cyanobacteriota bacterium]|nr:hypothetical protein [Cyanobacteriota bacterium]